MYTPETRDVGSSDRCHSERRHTLYTQSDNRVSVFGLPSGWGYDVGTVQLLITIFVAAFDIWFVWRVIWIPFVQKVKREDRPYLFATIGEQAKGARIAAETVQKIRGADDTKK